MPADRGWDGEMDAGADGEQDCVGGHDGRCEGGTIFEGGICGGVGGKG